MRKANCFRISKAAKGFLAMLLALTLTISFSFTALSFNAYADSDNMSDPEQLTLGETKSGIFPAYDSDTLHNQYHYFKFTTQSVKSDYIVKARTSDKGGETIQITVLDADKHEMVGRESGLGALPFAVDCVTVSESTLGYTDEAKFSYLKPNTTYYLKVKRLGQHYEADASSYSVSVETASWSGDSDKSFDINYDAAEYKANAMTLELGVPQNWGFPAFENSISQNHYHYYKFKTKKSADKYVLHIKTPETSDGVFRAYLMDSADHEQYASISAVIGYRDYLLLGPTADKWTHEDKGVYHDLKPDTTYYVKVKSPCSNQENAANYTIWIESSDSPVVPDDEWTINDEWTFNNYDSSPIRLTSADHNKLVAGRKWLERQMIEEYIETAGEGGNCFGMSSTAILAKKNVVPAKTLTHGCNTLKQAKKTKAVESTIGYYQLAQHSIPFWAHRKMFVLTHKSVESQIKALENADFPCLVSLTGEDGGHAVVATGVEYKESGSYESKSTEFDSKKYNARIIIYDCNDHEEEGSYARNRKYLYFNTENYDSWWIPYYNNYRSDKGAEIESACSDTSAFTSTNYTHTTAATFIRILMKGAATYNSADLVKLLDGEVWDDDKLTAYRDLGGSSMMNIRLDEETNFWIVPEKPEKLEFCVLNPHNFMKAKADSYSYIDSINGSMFAREIVGKYDFSVSTDDAVWKTVRIKGSDPEYLRMDITDEGVVIAGENLDSATIIVKNETGEKEGTLKTDSREILVKNDTEKVRILADTDFDGTYDKDITPVFNDEVTKVVTANGTIRILSRAKKTAAFAVAKNRKSVTVPDTAKIGGKTYKVVQIDKNAFRGKKIRKVTIGKNVKVIKAKAFSKSKATVIILKTKLLKKSNVKSSLKSSKIKTVKVKLGSGKQNKKYKTKYKKIFTKKNAGQKVKVR